MKQELFLSCVLRVFLAENMQVLVPPLGSSEVVTKLPAAKSQDDVVDAGILNGYRQFGSYPEGREKWGLWTFHLQRPGKFVARSQWVR